MKADSLVHAGFSWREGLGVFGGALLVFALLAHPHFEGDGVRWYCGETEAPVIRPGGSSHALAAVPSWLAIHVASLFGHSYSTTEGRLAAIAIGRGMSNVSGALTLAFLAGLLSTVGVRRWVRLTAVACVGLSAAFLYHATNVTEPMVAMPWALAAVWVAAKRRTVRDAVLIGLLLGIGGGFYESFLIAGGAIAALLWRTSEPEKSALAIATAGAVSAITFVSIVVFVFTVWGTRDVVGALGQLRETGSAGGLFGVFSPRRLGSALFGFANALAPLMNWRGASLVLNDAPGIVAYNLIITLLSLSFLATTVVLAKWQRRREENVGALLNALYGGLIWLTLCYCLSAFWEPTYTKLWIGGAVSMGIVASAVAERCLRLRERGVAEPKTALGLMIALWAGVIAIGFPQGAIERASTRNEAVAAARDLARRLTSESLLVTPGWDEVSVYLNCVVRPRVRVFSLTDVSVAANIRGESPERAVREGLVRSEAAGADLYFLDVLEMNADQWDPFFGHRLGLPRSVLDEHRARRGKVESLRHGGHEWILTGLRRGTVRP